MKSGRPVAGAILAVSVAIAGLLVLVILVRTWGLTQSVRESQKSNTRTLDLIESCTTVGGDCYEDSQQRTADVVRLLNGYQRRVVTLAAACADRADTQTAAQIRRCIDDGLRAAD